MDETVLREAIIACGRITSLLEREAPPHELLEPLTSLIAYLGSLIEGGTLGSYLTEEAREVLGALKRCRDRMISKRAEAYSGVREHVEVCRGFLKALLGLRGAREVESLLISIREGVRSGSHTSTDVLDRLSEAVSRIRGLPGAATALEKLEDLYECISSLEGGLSFGSRDAILRAIDDVIFYLSREESRRGISESSRSSKPEVLPVEIVVQGESFRARTPFFLGREPESRKLCVRDASRFIELEAELVAARSEELRLDTELFPPVKVFNSEVAQGVSRLQAYIYARRGVLFLAATGRRPIRILRGDGMLTVTRGYYSGEIVELGVRSRIEIEGAPPIELRRETRDES